MFVRHPFNLGSRMATNLCHNWNRSPCLKSPRFAMCWILFWYVGPMRCQKTVLRSALIAMYTLYIYTYISQRFSGWDHPSKHVSPHLSACHETMARSGTCRGRPSIILPWLACPHVYVVLNPRKNQESYEKSQKLQPIPWFLEVPEKKNEGPASRQFHGPSNVARMDGVSQNWGFPEGYVSGISSISVSGIGVVLR